MTTSKLGRRQRGDLDGRLQTPFQPAHIIIAAGDDVAGSRSGQHLLWMLTNLLARQVDEVVMITFEINPELMVLGGISPLLPQDLQLHLALRQGAVDINPGFTTNDSPPSLRIQVGPETALAVQPLPTFYVSATSWRGYIGTEAATWTCSDGNPVGPYVAACLAAAEVFKMSRGVQPEYGSTPQRLWYDAWHMDVSNQGEDGPALPEDATGIPAVLGGVGAVGTALLHTLYAVPGLKADIIIVDYDPEGIDVTNLNRYTLFGQSDLGQPKASRAAWKLKASGLHITPRDLLWQQWAAEYSKEARPLVMSCVDNNAARHAIQSSLPDVILSASTLDLRAQVIGFERVAATACLRCRNPVEESHSDESVIASLRAADPVRRAALAAERGVNPDDLEQFLEDPQAHCGLISGETLQRFGPTNAAAEHWSVGFVSAMAGVLLAAEYLKRTLQTQAPALSGSANMARFQFWHPASHVNTVCHWPAAPECICQTPTYQTAITAHPYMHPSN